MAKFSVNVIQVIFFSNKYGFGLKSESYFLGYLLTGYSQWRDIPH